ncbi:hypothetical protein [Kitasatospora sp. McL0602]|uniref:hypothetical protein n=1 Tax=Kitasatospora sp. McL0602 TaxID=3439530 RepID=UPI003F89046A
MLRDAVRGVTALAVELTEEATRRAVGAATGLLERSGVDVAVVERVVAEQFPPSVKSLQMLAGEAVTVGRAGVDLAVGVARSEVERIFERVGDQVVKVGVVLGYLESRLRDVDEAPAQPEGRAEGLFEAGWEAEPVPEEEPAFEAVPEPEPEPVVAVKTAMVKNTAVKKTAVAKKTVAKKTAVKKAAPAKKAAAKKATAKDG